MKEPVLRGTPPKAGPDVGDGFAAWGCSRVEVWGCVGAGMGAGVGICRAGSWSRAHGVPQSALCSLPAAGRGAYWE